jgi:SecD/SecF fusion protein
MRHNRFLQSVVIILVAVLLGFYDLTGELQKQIFPFLPQEFYAQKVNLGLDLQGGSQLDYKVSLDKVPEKDRSSIVEGIINVIQKRVNGLGVSEPNIYASGVGDESHIIVELAGIKDLDKAKETVGKTIQLEFKERKETPDPSYAVKVKEQAEATLKSIKDQDFKIFGEGLVQSNPGKVNYTESPDWQFKDQLATPVADVVTKLQVGQVADKLIETSGEYALDQQGSLVQMTGYSIVKLQDKQTVDRTINDPKKVKTAHILIAYKGASGAAGSITRSEEEAKKLADEVLAKLQQNKPEFSFDALAKQYSDDSSNKDKGGLIDDYIFDKANYAQEYKTAALALTKTGEISAVTKSPFGFHIIKAIEIKDPLTSTVKEDQYKIGRIFYNSADDMWQDTGLNGQYFQRADIDFDQLYQPHVVITFNPEGAKMFEDITGRNVNKPIAIFVGGNMISAPNVSEKIAGGHAIITGRFTVKEAEELARDLNTGAIPAPIILVGQNNIGASLGQDALNKSLMAGAIGLLMIALFMIALYRWAGVLATVALFFYTSLLVFLVKVALPLPLALGISILVFGFLIYKILNGKESGPEKMLALILSCFVLFFLSFLLSTGVVMTLAGIAGVILSIGMAVDANILIFERVKEELRDGRPVESAVSVGFDRAWSSIKDSNFSSLITCAILFYFGSSIIQGFAFNLAAGILVSMFSAISITRVMLTAALNTKLGQTKLFFGKPKKLHPKLMPIVPKRKVFYTISILATLLSIVSLFVVGLRPSLDFTGGSLMEIKFEKTVTPDELRTALLEIQDKINQTRSSLPSGITVTTTTPATTSAAAVPAATPTTTASTATSEPAQEIKAIQGKLDLGTIHIVTLGDLLSIKSKDISAADHDQIIKELKTKFGNVEEKRFQSVGPTIGDSLRNKALLAVLLASIAIVCYIAFAFRRVPTSVGKWKFGISAIIALLHDIIVLVGIYIVLGVVMGLEVDALFITAILTIMGFSIHDTIVVLDRLREKLKAPAKDKTFADISNEAVNETFARSVNTSITAAMTLFALVLFGAESIRGFCLALLIGVIVGTYSSIFVATPILVDWYNKVHQKKQ